MPGQTDTVLHRWFEEVWNQGREEAIDELMTEDAIAHGLEDDIRGREAFKPFFRKFRAAFPDMRISIEDAVADGDMVVVRCLVTGTHTGPGVLDAPTGKRASMTGICMARVRDGRIAEGWNNFDFLSLYQHLGMKLS
jgi:steroid delta-isomerase-like uncharacterized protein